MQGRRRKPNLSARGGSGSVVGTHFSPNVEGCLVHRRTCAVFIELATRGDVAWLFDRTSLLNFLGDAIQRNSRLQQKEYLVLESLASRVVSVFRRFRSMATTDKWPRKTTHCPIAPGGSRSLRSCVAGTGHVQAWPLPCDTQVWAWCPRGHHQDHNWWAAGFYKAHVQGHELVLGSGLPTWYSALSPPTVSGSYVL